VYGCLVEVVYYAVFELVILLTANEEEGLVIYRSGGWMIYVS